MITIEEIEKLAALSRIKLTSDEKSRLEKEIGSILAYMDQIKEVSSETHGEKKYTGISNVFRDDADPHDSALYTEAILKNAPRREAQCVKVKKIL